MINKKRIFITGATSAIMQKYISLIDREQYEVCGLTRTLKDTLNTAVHWVEGDIRNTDTIAGYLQECTIVVHAAAVTHSFDEQPYYDVNLHATRRLVDVVQRLPLEKFIYVSSRAAGYDSGAYGISKILAEEYTMRNLDRWLIIRLSEIYGGNESEPVSSMIHDAMTKHVVVCPMNVPSKLYPIHIDDAARIMHDYSFKKDVNKEVVTLNGREGYSYREILRYASGLSPTKPWIIPIPRCVMYFAKNIIQWFHIKSRVVPDQILRLYSIKRNQDLGYDMTSFKEYMGRFVRIKK